MMMAARLLSTSVLVGAFNAVNITGKYPGLGWALRTIRSWHAYSGNFHARLQAMLTSETMDLTSSFVLLDGRWSVNPWNVSWPGVWTLTASSGGWWLMGEWIGLQISTVVGTSTFKWSTDPREPNVGEVTKESDGWLVHSPDRSVDHFK